MLKYQGELILTTNMVQAHLAINMIHNLRRLHLEHYILLVDQPETCAKLQVSDWPIQVVPCLCTSSRAC
jgi:hypothetical protein